MSSLNGDQKVEEFRPLPPPRTVNGHGRAAAPRFHSDPERSCLGIQLAWPNVIGEWWLPEADVYSNPAHTLIARAIADVADAGQSGLDAVLAQLELHGVAARCGDTQYLQLLVDELPARRQCEIDAATVREKHAIRQAANPAPLFDAHEWVGRLREWREPAELPNGPGPVEFEVEGLIPARKVGALVAAGGTGKTTLLLTMYVCGAIGRPFLGRKVRLGTYVLLSNDDSQEDLDRALVSVVQAMKLSDQEQAQVRRRVRLHSLQGLDGEKAFTGFAAGAVMPTGFEDLVVAALEGVKDLRILALDTLRQFSGGSTNDEQVVKLTISGAQGIAQRLGCAVAISHHTGKNNYRDGITDMYCGSGSAAIADNCRFVMLLQTTTWSDIESKVRRTGQERGDPLVLQSTRGSLLVKASPPVFLHRDGFYLGLVEGAVLTRNQVLDGRDRAVLEAVRAGHESNNAIARQVGGKKANVLACIKDLESRGHIANSSPNGSQSRPVFVLTGTGANFLEQAE